MRIHHLILIFLFFSCTQEQKKLSIKGSDTEVNLAVLLAESFRNVNHKMLVSVSGGGSGLGIASLLNGTADIANSSRRMNTEELSLFAQRGIVVDSFIFAQDAIAFIVSEKLGIDSISIVNLAKVLSGDVVNWSEFTNKNLPINIYGRQSNSGTHHFVKKVLDIHFSTHAKQMNGNAQILEAIKADDSGIGYVGAGYVMNNQSHGVKILKIYSANTEAMSPLDAARIASGDYFFQRPLYQYFKMKDSGKVQSFLDFEKSETGKAIIHSSGYYSTNK